MQEYVSASKNVVNSLSRCAFLLHKLLDGDIMARANSPDAITEAVSLLKELDEDEEWMEEYE